MKCGFLKKLSERKILERSAQPAFQLTNTVVATAASSLPLPLVGEVEHVPALGLPALHHHAVRANMHHLHLAKVPHEVSEFHEELAVVFCHVKMLVLLADHAPSLLIGVSPSTFPLVLVPVRIPHSSQAHLGPVPQVQLEEARDGVGVPEDKNQIGRYA